VFYLMRLFGYPENLMLANTFSNIVRLLSTIFIFLMTFILLQEHKKLNA
jgi:hypothetical protein